MKIILQIVATFALVAWPMLAFMSVMLFDAPGSSDRLPNIIFAMLVLFYPVAVGALFYFMDLKLWSFIPPAVLLGITIVAPIVMAVLLGYPKLLLNAAKGISSEGYSVKGTAVYYAGDKIAADGTSFEVLKGELNFFGRDQDHVFYLGNVIHEADPASFQILQKSYVKDKNHVFIVQDRSYIILEGARAETFVVNDDTVNEVDATDGINRYWYGKKK